MWALPANWQITLKNACPSLFESLISVDVRFERNRRKFICKSIFQFYSLHWILKMPDMPQRTKSDLYSQYSKLGFLARQPYTFPPRKISSTVFDL